MSDARDLAQAYRSALHDYLRGVGEPALAQAYALGRQALREGLGILDMATIHREALQEAGLDGIVSVEGARTAKHATEFFLESVSAFELVERGFRDANVTLRRLNDMLEHRTHELETTNRELAKEIAERRLAEERLRESEDACGPSSRACATMLSLVSTFKDT